MTDDAQTKTQSRRSRTVARVAAVQALFQCEQGGENAETVISQFQRHRLGGTHETVRHEKGFDDGYAPDADFRLFGLIVKGVTLSQDRLDTALTEALPESWPLGRLDPVLRALLRAGAWELGEDIPTRVVINEYLDVAHGFFSGDEARLVNGVLDALTRKKANPTEAPRTPEVSESADTANAADVAESRPEDGHDTSGRTDIS